MYGVYIYIYYIFTYIYQANQTIHVDKYAFPRNTYV